MLRVGLTGSLGSGKSTVAAMLRERGARVIEADRLGRELMEPGEAVYKQIVAHFGAGVVAPDGRLNRTRLGELAFKQGRLQELNAIVHPAVIAAEERRMEEIFARDSDAIAILESALIFEVVRDARARGETDGPLADWRRRFDRVVVVTAPDELKITRYANRVGANANNATPEALAVAEAEARNRLRHQVPDAEKAAQADDVLDNSGNLAQLREQVDALWKRLKADSQASA